MFELLLPASAKSAIDRLMVESIKGDFQVFLQILSKSEGSFDVDKVVDEDGLNLLHLASSLNKYRAVEFLLALGANVNEPDS